MTKEFPVSGTMTTVICKITIFFYKQTLERDRVRRPLLDFDSIPLEAVVRVCGYLDGEQQHCFEMPANQFSVHDAAQFEEKIREDAIRIAAGLKPRTIEERLKLMGYE